MFMHLGNLVTRWWGLVILLWIILIAVIIPITPKWDDVVQDGNSGYMPKQMTSVRGEAILAQAFPGDSPLLSPPDVYDWTELARTWVVAAEDPAESTPKALFPTLPMETQDLFRQVAMGSIPTTEEEQHLADALNVWLADPKWSESPAVQGVTAPKLPKAKGTIDDPNSPRQIQLRNRLVLETIFPQQIAPIDRGRAQSQIVLVVARPDAPLTEDDLAYADLLSAQFTLDEAGTLEEGKLPQVTHWDRLTPVIGDELISKDKQAVLIVLGMATEFMEVASKQVTDITRARFDAFVKDNPPPAGLELGVSGSAAVGGDTIVSSDESLRNTELATITLVLVMLLIVYRAPLLMFIPVLTIGVSAFVALHVITILASIPEMHFQIFSASKVFIIVILFGAGTDFCLFLISRYKENIDHGLPRLVALNEAQGQVGHVLAASAMTSIMGLGVMYFADFGKYHHSGPAIALGLVVALMACLTLAPALLRLFGGMLFWPWGEPHSQVPATAVPVVVTPEGSVPLPAAEPVAKKEPSKSPLHERIWEYVADGVLARPGLVLAASYLAMFPLAYMGHHVDVTFDMLAELQATRPSVVATRLVARHFDAGSTGPVTILAFQPRGGLDTQAGSDQIGDLTRQLNQINTKEVVNGQEILHGVVNVRSLSQPLGNNGGNADFVARRHRKAREHYLTQVPGLAGKYTRFEVVLDSDPFSVKSMHLVSQIDEKLQALRADPASPWYGASFDLIGVSAGIRDLDSVTRSDLWKISLLVVIVVFGVLVVLLRDLLVSLYLMFSVLFSYYATLGVTEWVFMYQYGAAYDGLDWKVPLFLFVILVAIGMDYNIYLITRVVEEQQQLGALEGIRHALVKTGSIITSCGMIMAGTFMSMMTGNLRGLTQLGFALSFGVLLDTFFVRTLLVPAFLALLYTRHRKLPHPSALIEPPATTEIVNDSGETTLATPHATEPVSRSAN